MSNYVEQVVVVESPKNNSGGNNFFYVPKATPSTPGIAKFNKTQFTVSDDGEVSWVNNFSDNVVQTTGDSETLVMSQKAVTNLAIERMPKLNILICDDYIAIDTINGTVTLPAKTEFVTGSFHKNLAENITITLMNPSTAFGNYILYNKSTDTFKAYGSWEIRNLNPLTDYYYLCAVRRGAAGHDAKPSCDLSVPHRLNGMLFGCGVPVIERLSIGVCYDFISIDNTAGTITIPAQTELYSGESLMVLSEDAVITMHDTYNTSGNVILLNKTTKEFENKTPSQYATIDKSNYCFAFFVRRTLSNLNFKSCADISVPYYVDGVLYGGAVADDDVVVTDNVPTLDIIEYKSFISIDNVNGTITIPAGTELLMKGLRINMAEDAVIFMSEVNNTSGNIIIYNKSTGKFENVYPWSWNTIDWTNRYYAFTVRRFGGEALPHANLSVPYYVDGVLYGAGNGGGNSNTENPIDNTKSKEFAELFYNSDKVEPFMFFTDPHLCQFEGDGWRSEFDEYMSALKAHYNESAVTRVFCGGDWLGGTVSDEKDACYRLGLADAKMREYFKEYYPIRGNHESNHNYNPPNPTLHRNAIRNLMFRKEGGTYYIVDGDNSKFFIFDTQDESDTLFDASYLQEQLTWFADHLINNTEENIVMMMHMVYNYNDATGTFSNLLYSANNIIGIANSFNNRWVANVVGKEYNFANAKGKVRFMIAGHTHKDYTTVISGIPTVITTNLRDGGVPTFDMCLADYSNNKLHLVRVGTGNTRTVSI